jgi:hypothetical protein
MNPTGKPLKSPANKKTVTRRSLPAPQARRDRQIKRKRKVRIMKRARLRTAKQ